MAKGRSAICCRTAVRRSRLEGLRRRRSWGRPPRPAGAAQTYFSEKKLILKSTGMDFRPGIARGAAGAGFVSNFGTLSELTVCLKFAICR